MGAGPKARRISRPPSGLQGDAIALYAGLQGQGTSRLPDWNGQDQDQENWRRF